MPSTAEDFEALYRRNIQMVYKICVLYMKNRHDAEDAAQQCFTSVYEHRQRFDDPEHEKAWLIVTAANACKSMLRRRHRRDVSLEEFTYEPVSQSNEASELLYSLMDLPEKYKSIIYLFYYEGYSCVEIASMLRMNESTVRSRLHRGRALLRLDYEGDIE